MKLSLSQYLQIVQSQSLSLAHQKKLGRTWDARIESPLAFVPTKVVEGGITAVSAIRANQELGEFAQNFLKKILNNFSEGDLERRQQKAGKVIAVGCGRGYDLHWVEQAVRANLRTIWLDVSEVACQMAAIDLNRQFEQIKNSMNQSYLRPLVMKAEIRSALVDPESIGLDLGSVEIWYMCRVLGCLSARSREIVLRRLGRSLAADGSSIVIVGALRDDNEQYTGSKNSDLLSLKYIQSNLERGAKMDVSVVDRASCQYFGKFVTALYIRTK